MYVVDQGELILMDNLFEKNIAINIEDEMKKSYMDYAMSVIIGRAIPDVRDGLKPVHRRVLFAMSEMGNRWNKPYKKSARIVGDIIGKYHPHGDTAAYDTMVRMAQEFSMRYLLVDGQGNFGSIDGDPPAAMRYTEVRMARISEELLADLEKNTVNFVPNYDESLEEPTVLPAKIPLLLLNGTGGIAVGVATNIPPHNLREVIDGTIALIRDPDITIDGLIHYIPGPDFPTAGFINGREGILSAYRTGRGIIRVRARALIEKNARNDRESIVVTELPYQVNKANLIEKISELVKEKKISGIADLRDESDREGIRVVLDLKRDEVSAVVLNQLYKHTQMESTFGIIMLAIDRGQPRVFNLKEVLQSFLTFRKEVVIRRTTFDLMKARERAHILEGLIIALDRIDEVIAVIKASANTQEASAALCSRFGLSEVQAKAILDMRLQRLTGLERDKIDTEYAEISTLILNLQGILDDPQKVLDVIIEELTEIRARYGDERRTEIVVSSEDIDIEDMIVEEDMVVTVSHAGYIKRNPVSLYKSQRRGGKGKIGMGTKEEDFVERIFIASTHHYLLIFTSKGQGLLAEGLPDPAGRAGRQGEGDRQPDQHGGRGARRRRSGRPGVHRGQIGGHGDQAGNDQEDGAVGLLQSPRGRYHRHLRRRGRRSDRCPAHPREPGHLPRHPEGQVDPLQGGRCPRYGPDRPRRPGDHDGRRRPRRRDGDPDRGEHHPHRFRKRVRKTDRDRRIPPPVPGREGDDQPEDRQGGRCLRYPPGHRKRRHRADQRRGPDRPHARRRGARHPPEHPGGAPDRSRSE